MHLMATIRASHIEKPEREFSCRVKRASVLNVLFKPERWEVWTVLAETKDGAALVARHHFYRSNPDDIIIQ